MRFKEKDSRKNKMEREIKGGNNEENTDILFSFSKTILFQ
jgi:hypothetical protein